MSVRSGRHRRLAGGERFARLSLSFLCVSSIIMWILTRFWLVFLVTPQFAGGYWGGVGFGQGAMVIAFATNPKAGMRPSSFVQVQPAAGPEYWWPAIANSPAGVQLICPLWITLALGGAGAVPLWRAWLWWRWLARQSGRCPVCGYDRSGLTPSAGCPECGAPPRNGGDSV